MKTITIKETGNILNGCASAALRALEAVETALQSGNTEHALHEAKYIRANLGDIKSITAGDESGSWKDAAKHFAK